MVTIFRTFRFYSAVAALHVDLSWPADLDRLRYVLFVRIKTLKEAAYLEICRLDWAFKIFQQFKFAASAGVFIRAQVLFLADYSPLQISLSLDAGDGTADFSQEMIQLPPIACFQSQRLEKGGPIVALQGLQANLSSRYQILT